MIRSVKYKLQPNQCKINILQQVTNDYRLAVNNYIESYITNGLPKSIKNCYKEHDTNTLKTKRLEDNAAKTAYEVVTSWQKSKHKNRNPTFYGSIKFNAKNAQIQESNNSFDKWIYIQPYKLYIPFNIYNHKWLKGKELKEITIINKNNTWYVKISYEIEPEPINFKTEITSVDAGINKLMTTPYNTYGNQKIKEQIKQTSNKIKELRKRINKLGYKNTKRLQKLEAKFTEFIKNTYHKEVNKLIKNESPKTIIVENLNIKNTKGKRNKSFNNIVSRSGLSGIKKIIQSKCEENCISFRMVNPAYTSQTCPSCGHVDKKNRVNESFQCVKCSFSGDADYVASINILRTFLRSDGSDKANTWWHLEFHHGVEVRAP